MQTLRRPSALVNFFCDGSTDSVVIEEEAIYVLYFDASTLGSDLVEMKTSFLHMHQSADGITSNLKSTLKESIENGFKSMEPYLKFLQFYQKHFKIRLLTMIESFYFPLISMNGKNSCHVNKVQLVKTALMLQKTCSLKATPAFLLHT